MIWLKHLVFVCVYLKVVDLLTVCTSKLILKWRIFCYDELYPVTSDFLISLSSTAAATFRQAVALIFDNVVRVESLPSDKVASGSFTSRASSVTDDVSRSINHSTYAFSTLNLNFFFYHSDENLIFCLHFPLREELKVFVTGHWIVMLSLES